MALICSSKIIQGNFIIINSLSVFPWWLFLPRNSFSSAESSFSFGYRKLCKTINPSTVVYTLERKQQCQCIPSLSLISLSPAFVSATRIETHIKITADWCDMPFISHCHVRGGISYDKKISGNVAWQLEDFLHLRAAIQVCFTKSKVLPMEPPQVVLFTRVRKAMETLFSHHHHLLFVFISHLCPSCFPLMILFLIQVYWKLPVWKGCTAKLTGNSSITFP